MYTDTQLTFSFFLSGTLTHGIVLAASINPVQKTFHKLAQVCFHGDSKSHQADNIKPPFFSKDKNLLVSLIFALLFKRNLYITYYPQTLQCVSP